MLKDVDVRGSKIYGPITLLVITAVGNPYILYLDTEEQGIRALNMAVRDDNVTFAMVYQTSGEILRSR
jgi:hypothetical protein